MFIETVPFTRTRVLILMGILLFVAFLYILLTSFFVFKQSCISSEELTILEEIASNTDRKEEPKGIVVFISGFENSSGIDTITKSIEFNPNVTCNRTISEIEYILNLYEKSSLKLPKQTQIGYQKVIESLLVGTLESSEVVHCYVEPNFLSSDIWLNIPYVRFLFVLEDVRAIAHTAVTQTDLSTANSKTYNSKSQTIYETVMEDWNKKMFTMNENCEALGDKCLKIKVEDYFADRWSTMKTVYEFFQLSWQKHSVFYKNFPTQRPSIFTIPDTSEESSYYESYEREWESPDWFETLPPHLEHRIMTKAPMLWSLGYNPFLRP